MDICVVSDNQDTLDVWSRLIPASFGFKFVNCQRAGRVGADLIVMWEIFAVERYGGKAVSQVAQVRANELEDGLPDWVVIAPSLPVVRTADGPEIRDDYKHLHPTYFAMIESLRTIRQEFGDSCMVELNLPLLTMDDPSNESIPKSAAKAYGEFLSEH